MKARLSNYTSAKHLFAVIVMLLMNSTHVLAQQNPDALPNSENLQLYGEVAGFIPFQQSYRINYQTSLAGLPVQVTCGIGFPITPSLSSVLKIHYVRRTAVFVKDFRIKTLEIEFGVRDYLEKQHDNDLRLFGGAGLLLGKSSATGFIDATSDGSAVRSLEVSKDYYNFGLGVNLGIEYPLTQSSGLYIGINVDVYFADPVSNGGLGNIGGVSVGGGYRINI